MTLRLNDYAEKLKIAGNILTRISLHSKNFPKFIPFAMHGELRKTHSDEFSKTEIKRFIELEKRAECIIKGHSLPENQRNYFKNAKYKNSCIYPKDWIDLLNLTSCICNKRIEEPTEKVVIDKSTGNAVDIITTESTKYYYALFPFKTAITLNQELNNLYTQLLTKFDIGRIPNPTNKSLSVSNMPEIIEDMISHCEIGVQEIRYNRVQSKTPKKEQIIPEQADKNKKVAKVRYPKPILPINKIAEICKVLPKTIHYWRKTGKCPKTNGLFPNDLSDGNQVWGWLSAYTGKEISKDERQSLIKSTYQCQNPSHAKKPVHRS